MGLHPITALMSALGVLTAVYIAGWTRAVSAVRSLGTRELSPATDARFPTPPMIGLGFVTNFFDALGIGSFATSTAAFRLLKMVPDRVIPGTLNAGHTLPTVAQAFIFTSIIPVDILTLLSMIVAAVLGAWLGAGVVARWSKRRVQVGMGAALLAAAMFMLMTQFGVFPAGSDEIGVRGIKLAIAVTGNFALGALMTLGIGLYAPCMVLVSLLGMSEKTAFPIMMGSCAFLMPIGSLRFIREQSYSLRVALGLALGGVIGSIVAGVFVKSLDLGTVRWLVIVVVLYTAVTMLMSAFSKNDQEEVPVRARV
ncbi:MAG: sulfite exporter TauE/SafE family protein [Acidobacteria bacterium]|nr:sulfite exporter TauE/SafE family protein [Acidobacteriota bacterium]